MFICGFFQLEHPADADATLLCLIIELCGVAFGEMFLEKATTASECIGMEVEGKIATKHNLNIWR